jgi:hypothetical protein
MKINLLSILTVFLLAGLVACSSPASIPPTTASIPTQPAPVIAPPSAPDSDGYFLARPDGAKGPAIAYDLGDGRELFQLPPGMAAANGNLFFATEATGSDTRLRSFDLATGRERPGFNLEGRWALDGVSPLGHWLALTRIPSESERQAWTKANEWKTEIQILETKTGGPKYLLALDGNYEVETVSADGTSLFLVQHLPAINPDHYLIRLYDLANETLIADPLRSKGADEVMAGYAWEGLASPNGKWLFTLYLSTKRNTAFVHTLNLVDKFPVCVDLPSGKGDFDQLKHYTLALNGSKLFAANAALGIVAEINLNDYQMRTLAKFDPGPLAKTDPQTQTARSVLSEDGTALYFTSGQGVWAYGTKAYTVNGPFRTEGATGISGLGVSADGGRLFVAQKNGPVMTFDTAVVAASQ